MKANRLIYILVGLVSAMVLLVQVPTVLASSYNQCIHDPDQYGEAYHPAVDSYGSDVHTVYASTLGGGIYNIRMISSANSGWTWGNRQWVAYNNSNNQDYPDIKIDNSTARVHFVWQELISGTWEIWYRWWNPGNNTWLSPIRISSASAVGDALYPKIAVRTDYISNVNWVHVVWQEDQNSTANTNWEIMCTHYRSGTGWTTPSVVSVNDGVDSIHPAVAAYFDPNVGQGVENVHIVWENASTPSEIWILNIPFGNPSISLPYQLSSATGLGAIYPDVTAKLNEVHVVWIEVNQFDTRIGKIYIAQSDINGSQGSWWKNGLLQPISSLIYADTNSSGPAVDFDGIIPRTTNGHRLAVAYTGYPYFNPLNPVQQNTELYCMIGDETIPKSQNFLWGNEIQETFTDGINGTLEYEHYPDVACENSTDLNTSTPDVWAHMVYDRQPVGGGPWGIWYIREP